jgi:hypothetical protein
MPLFDSVSFSLRLSAVLVLASIVRAEEVPLDDADLPQPFDQEAIAGDLLTVSPFTRVVNLEDTLQLTGIAYVEGRPVATFLNKATQQHVTVSEEPNADGWRISSTTPGDDLHDTEVQLMIGSEIITLHYGDAQLTPGGSKKGEPGVYSGPFRSGMNFGSKDDNRPRTSSFLGDKGRELYNSLSRDGRDKLKEAVHSYLDKNPNRTPEQTSSYAQKIFSKIKAAESKTPGSSSSSNNNPKPSKTVKPNKNR